MDLSQCEYMIVFNEHVLQQRALDAVVEHTAGRLGQAGLVVERLKQKPILVVRVPKGRLEVEAQRQGYLKGVGGEGDVMEFVLGDKTSEVFKGYPSSDFWTRAEEAALFLSVIEGVGGVEGLEEPFRGLKKSAKNAALKVPSSLIAALRIAELIESVAPLHQSGKKTEIWKVASKMLLTPEDPLAEYFGPTVAMYFTWLNMFTIWLMVPAVVGVLFYVHKRFYGYTVDDHPYLPFYGLFVVFWAVTFLAFWKRRAARKSWQWKVYEPKRDLDMPRHIRPEFRGNLQKSRVTGRQQRVYPYWKRLIAYALSVAVTSIMLCLAFFVMILSLNLQGYIDGKIVWEEPLHFPSLGKYALPGELFDPNQTEYLGLLTFIPTIMHVIVIMQLNGFYRKVAAWLTHNENHRLEIDHENSLILKRFLFESFDCYISLFYLGFVQQDVRRLRLELISLYTVDSIRRVTLETALPFLLGMFESKKVDKMSKGLEKEGGTSAALIAALRESHLAEYEAFDDYLEMVIEYGYVVLFASAFPLAAALSVVCNVVEMKSDLFKLTKVYQRPTPSRSDNIGIWENLLWSLTWLAIFTNSMLLVSSDQLAAHFPSLYRDAIQSDVAAGRVASLLTDSTHHELVIKRGAARWVLIIAFVCERLAFITALVLTRLIPEIPDDVLVEIQRHEYQKTLALKEKAGGNGGGGGVNDKSNADLLATLTDFNNQSQLSLAAE